MKKAIEHHHTRSCFYTVDFHYTGPVFSCTIESNFQRAMRMWRE